MLVNITNLYKYFNGEALLKDINLTIENKETIGLIGSNGCGKTTLLNIIAGNLDFDKTADGLGAVSISNNVTIGFLRQNSGLESNSTIDEEMHKAFEKLIETKSKMELLEKQMAESTGDELEFISSEYAQLSAFLRLVTAIELMYKSSRFSMEWDLKIFPLTELSVHFQAEKKLVLH